MRLKNERERLSTNMPQSNVQNVQTVPANNKPYVSNARESFSDDQLAQIMQSISSFFESHHAKTTATRVDEHTTNPPTPHQRLEQLSQFPFLSSINRISSHGPVASIQKADRRFTSEIPNKYFRDMENGDFWTLPNYCQKI
jgi:hypothetical protein